ncbi:helix-turn-helix domain-containing protein [Leeuwenhoekiella marinoflava]|nr:helix-turn-helix domain-containing protein [Leeuwenhoekiella marinoflava]
MKNTFLSESLKEVRKRKGLTQEELAENSKLSLRTIQRLEGSETTPNGETLRRITNALNIDQNELTDWELKTDVSFLKSINSSALSFLLFPILGILLPSILWGSKKGQVNNLNRVAKAIINFQITWNLLFFIGLIFGAFIVTYKIETTGFITPSHFETRNQFYLYFIGIMYVLNLIIILFNHIRLQKEKEMCYPKINFIGK